MAPPPPLSHLSKKPNVQSFKPAASRTTEHPNPGKSCSSFFSKSLVILLVLLVIPLFPSQAPDFFSQTILTKFWELFHLLFIGIAVSYGLFSWRSPKMVEIEDLSRPHSSSSSSNPTYFSGISNVSSFFEEGFQNLCSSDEKKMMHTLNPHHLYSESVFERSSVSNGAKKIRSFTQRNDFEDTNGENVSDIWNSQYFPGENLVVVTDGNYTLEEHKPLGLPIRSLRSRIARAGKLQFAYRNGSNSSLKSRSSNENEVRVEKVRVMTPTNLGNKFEEASSPSTIPWKSKSVKMEMREDVGNGGHSRPHSVGEFEFMQQQIKSRSFVRTVSSSSSSSSRSKSSKSSVSQELSDMKAGNLGNKRDLHSSSVEAKGFTTCSFSDLDMQRISEDDEFKNFSRVAAKQHLFGGGKPDIDDPVSPDAKPPPPSSSSSSVSSNLSKILSKAKSVRTFRSGKHVLNKMKKKDEIGAVDDQFVPAILENTETIKSKDPSPPFPPPLVDIQKQNSDKDNHSTVFPDHQNTKNKHPVVSDLSSKSECESFNDQESSDEDENGNGNININISAEVENEEIAGSEVDRKADEFIAKFREQIRLQKIGSVRKSKFSW